MTLRPYFLEHLWLKVFALILAMLIWLTVNGNVDRESREEIRTFGEQSVALLRDSAERRNFVLDPPRVSVTVKGAKSVLDHLKPSDLHAYVELASHAGNAGNYLVEAHSPPGVIVVLVTPRTIFVSHAEQQ